MNTRFLHIIICILSVFVIFILSSLADVIINNAFDLIQANNLFLDLSYPARIIFNHRDNIMPVYNLFSVAFITLAIHSFKKKDPKNFLEFFIIIWLAAIIVLTTVSYALIAPFILLKK